jgi:hypothetical protein
MTEEDKFVIAKIEAELVRKCAKRQAENPELYLED